MAGWRRSADRARLPADSLLTGNFTGNFAILGVEADFSEQEAAVPQRLFEQFPTQTSREDISGNREYFTQNREFCLLNGKTAMPPRRRVRRELILPIRVVPERVRNSQIGVNQLEFR